MAIKTCTGVTGRPYVHVEVRLSQSATITATGLDAPLVTNATGDVTGAYSITLWANNDLTPNGTYYTVTEYLGTTDNTFTIQVPQTAGPFTMPSILVTAPTASPSPNHVSTLIVDTTAAVGSLTVTAGETGIDTAAAGVLEIGGDNATSVEIGPANVLVDASGNVAARSFTAGNSPYAASSIASSLNNEYRLAPPGGLGDDQALFDAAFTALAAIGGGTIVCQPGTYRAEPRLKSYIKLKGSNHYGTIIKRRDASTTADVIALFSARQEQCEVEDLQIDGNTGASRAAGTGHGVYIQNDSIANGPFASGLNGPSHRFKNLFIRNTNGDGLRLDGDSNGGECAIDSIRTYFCNGNGIYTNTPDNTFSNIDCGQSGLWGINDNSGFNRWSNCKAWYSGKVTASDGFRCGIYSVYTGCVGENNVGSGFFLFNRTNVTLVGFRADGNSTNGNPDTQTTPICWGVDMRQATGCVVVGECVDTQVTPTQQYGVNIDGTASKNIVNVTGSNQTVGLLPAAALTSDNLIISGYPGTAFSRFGGTSSFDILSAVTSIAAGSNTAAGGSQFSINGAAASNRDLLMQTAGVARWILRANNTAEGGANAGSDLQLFSRDDAGALLLAVLAITRSSGLMTLGEGVNVALGTTTGTKLGTGTTQKLSFYNATPIVQPASTTDLRAALINLGLLATGGATPLDLNGGNLTVGSSAATGTAANFNGAAGNARSIIWQTAGTSRWIARANATAEGGSNAGSDWELVARDDSGVLLFNALSIKRSTGAVTLANKIFPGTDAGAVQGVCGLFAGTGVPSNANGTNGDVYFRSDGGAGTTIYQRRAGSWVATAA